MRNRSPNPLVISSSVRLPLRSSSALVATVVPIFTASTVLSGIGSEAPSLRISRMPCTAASAYCSGFSESSLCVSRLPSDRRPTMSVKVPPRSIQNCHIACVPVLQTGINRIGSAARERYPETPAAIQSCRSSLTQRWLHRSSHRSAHRALAHPEPRTG